jgi:hypothetical protein
MRHAWLLIAVAGCRCNDPKQVAATLDGLRWEMPCKPPHGEFCSSAVDKVTKTAKLGGDPATTYAVTLHFRGVVEQEAYDGGKAEGSMYVGGHATDNLYNIYELATSAPAQVFYLNPGHASLAYVWPIDYQQTIRIQGGSTVTLVADPQDGNLVSNVDEHGKPIVVLGMPPAPAPFDGQFIQMDVVSVAPATGTP